MALPTSPKAYGVVDPDDFPSIAWNPREGRHVEYSRSLLRSNVTALEALLQTRGFAYSVTPTSGAKAMVKWSAPFQQVVENWTPRFNETQQSLWLDAAVRTEMAKITDIQLRAQFRADIEAVLAGEKTYTDSNGALQPLSFDIIFNNGNLPAGLDRDVFEDKLFPDLIAGVANTLPVSTPVLQLSRVFPSFTVGSNPPTPYLSSGVTDGPYPAAVIDYSALLLSMFANINFIYTTEQLIAIEPTMPVELKAVYRAITAAASAGPEGATPGYWLKKAPEGDQLEDGRWHFRVEYWFAERIGELASARLLA